MIMMIHFSLEESLLDIYRIDCHLYYLQEAFK